MRNNFVERFIFPSLISFIGLLIGYVILQFIFNPPPVNIGLIIGGHRDLSMNKFDAYYKVLYNNSKNTLTRCTTGYHIDTVKYYYKYNVCNGKTCESKNRYFSTLSKCMAHGVRKQCYESVTYDYSRPLEKCKPTKNIQNVNIELKKALSYETNWITSRNYKLTVFLTSPIRDYKLLAQEDYFYDFNFRQYFASIKENLKDINVNTIKLDFCHDSSETCLKLKTDAKYILSNYEIIFL